MDMQKRAFGVKGLRMKLIDILYPHRCAVCDRAVLDHAVLVCEECRKTVSVIKNPRCLQCSKPLDSSEKEYCLDCQKSHHEYERGFAAFLYQGEMQESLMRFKYGGRQEYGVFYGRSLAGLALDFFRKSRPEVLIPVPVHRSKLLRRGYNQAEVLAEELSKRWKIPMDTECIKRSKHTKAQKNLTPKERRENLMDAFEVCGKVPWKSVMIVDDIYTTGSTVDALAKKLKAAGVKQVYFITVCIGSGDS